MLSSIVIIPVNNFIPLVLVPKVPVKRKTTLPTPLAIAPKSYGLVRLIEPEELALN
jgi:hypothetical protein